jgi:hypothetical protein
MAITDDGCSSILQAAVLIPFQEGCQLSLNGLLNQLACAFSQHFCQRVGRLISTGKLDNGILVHGGVLEVV